MRAIWALVAALALAGPAGAQDFSGVARLDPSGSAVADVGGSLAVELALSQPVPWRLVTLDAPPRLAIEFRVLDWQAADLAGLVTGGLATGARAGAAEEEGWSRLLIDLAGPMAVAEAGMAVDPSGGPARLRLRLDPVDAESLAAGAGTLPEEPALGPPAAEEPRRLVVAIDPGHGGIDPGAERGGVKEADLMLALGLELAEAAARAGMVPVLTRSGDVFVPLAARMTIARGAGADVLVSLHADALEADAARGASVYTLSQEAAGDASARTVERHERGDLIAGLDLGGADDPVAVALLDLARQDTGPASRRLAEAMVAGIEGEGAPVAGRPHREARLAVLGAADFPSVLVETGFLSDDADRERLSTPGGRAPLVAGLLAALAAWEAEEAGRGALRMR